MRIAFVSHSRRKVGGAETYLDSVIPAIAAAGHEVSLLHESDTIERDLIATPPGSSTWDVSRNGIDRALQELRHWEPDVCFVHGLRDSALEAEIVALGNAVLYLHNYYGSCISGNKMIYNGSPTPCERTFGPACLLHYFPDRCGGRNPLTMLQLYTVQSHRLKLMHDYRALIANSGHLRREMARYNLTTEVVCPFTTSSVLPDSRDLRQDPLRITFAGRMHHLKGGPLLIAALPEVQRRLGRKIHVTFAGEGPDSADWQRHAKALSSGLLQFEFTGWLSSEAMHGVLAQTHLLVMPSIWPEPFGLSGLEAGLHGVPTVAFAVGGIPEWLHDGVNGHLTPAPSSAANLAKTIVVALSDEGHYQRLRSGAREEALKYDLPAHLNQLSAILSRCSA